MTEIFRSQIGVLTYLAPNGPLIDPKICKELSNVVTQCIDSKETDIVLDLSKVSLVNGEALDTLIDLQDSLSRYGGSLKTINANALVSDIFSITNFNDYIASIDQN